MIIYKYVINEMKSTNKSANPRLRSCNRILCMKHVNGQDMRLPFTLIKYYHILVFVLKIRKKGGKKVMHCRDLNQGPLTYESIEKKKRNALPGLEPETPDLDRVR